MVACPSPSLDPDSCDKALATPRFLRAVTNRVQLRGLCNLEVRTYQSGADFLRDDPDKIASA
jgi:hypothetical protein